MKKRSHKFILVLCLGIFAGASMGQEETVTFSDFEAELRELEVSQGKVEDLALMRVEGLDHGNQAAVENTETPKEIYEDSVNHSQASTLSATKEETLEEKAVAPSTSPRIRRVRSR